MIRQSMIGMAVLCCVIGAAAVKAQDAQTGVFYRLSQDPRNPTYEIALQHMESMYKKDPWHWDGASWLHYPIIGLGDTYLNNDQLPEIIAYPTEDIEEIGKFCVDDGKCPHFVLEVRPEGVKRLGMISAYTLTRDDKITNGYWNLRVYTKHPDEDAYFYEIYAYDVQKDAYVPAQ